MISDIDDNSWEQVYGLMRCSTKFEKLENPDKAQELTEIEYFDY